MVLPKNLSDRISIIRVATNLVSRLKVNGNHADEQDQTTPFFDAINTVSRATILARTRVKTFFVLSRIRCAYLSLYVRIIGAPVDRGAMYKFSHPCLGAGSCERCDRSGTDI